MTMVKRRTNGFVFIELIVMLGMVAVLGGLIVTNLFGSQRKAHLVGTIEPLIADIKSQQAKAMTREAVEGSIPAGYGVRFETTRYVLFHGATYNPADMSNQIFPLEDHVTCSEILVPDGVVVFRIGSGELASFVSGQDRVTLRTSDTNETKTIQFNRYGIITSIQ